MVLPALHGRDDLWDIDTAAIPRTLQRSRRLRRPRVTSSSALTGARHTAKARWVVRLWTWTHYVRHHLGDPTRMTIGPDSACDQPDGRWLCYTASQDARLIVWDARTAPRSPNPDRGMAVHQPGQSLRASGDTPNMRLWDLHHGAELARFDVLSGIAAGLSPDEQRCRRIRSVNEPDPQPCAVHGIRYATGQATRQSGLLQTKPTNTAHTSVATCLQRDGRAVLKESIARHHLDVTTGQRLRSSAGHSASVTAIGERDGHSVLSGE